MDIYLGFVFYTATIRSANMIVFHAKYDYDGEFKRFDVASDFKSSPSKTFKNYFENDIIKL